MKEVKITKIILEDKEIETLENIQTFCENHECRHCSWESFCGNHLEYGTELSELLQDIINYSQKIIED